jgi:hypothetical protein
LLPRPKLSPRMLAPSGVSAAALVLNHTPSPKILALCGGVARGAGRSGQWGSNSGSSNI